jgi:hypothetical protein
LNAIGVLRNSQSEFFGGSTTNSEGCFAPGRVWHGIPRPWDQYIGQIFGKYTLTSYHNLPNDNPSNSPPVYEFSLIDSNFKIIKIEVCNILQLENFCKSRVP